MFAAAVGWRQLVRGEGRECKRNPRGCWVAIPAAPSQLPSQFCSACSGLKAGQTGGWLGKASPWLAEPAAVTCPAWITPVCSPQPKDLAGRCSSSLALAVTGTSGLGQHSGFPGMEGQQGQMPSRILALLPSCSHRDTAVAAGCATGIPRGQRGCSEGSAGQPQHCPVSTSLFSFPHCPALWKQHSAVLTLLRPGSHCTKTGQ